MKNQNKIQWTVWAFSVILIVFIAGCSSSLGNRVEVMIELPAAHIVDFSKYEAILYKDITLETIPTDVNPLDEIKIFFLQDLGRTIDKTITPWDKEKHETSTPQNTLIISGHLKIEVKTRSKIDNVKDESTGKGKKGFVTVQHWEMTLTIVFTDTTTQKEVFRQDFKSKLANVDAKTPKYNFEDLFYKVTNEFTKRVTRTKKMQRRYIIL